MFLFLFGTSSSSSSTTIAPVYNNSILADIVFGKVTMLLKTNGVINANNNAFIDSSTNVLAITRNGNPTQGSFSPFKSASPSFAFSTIADYISLPVNTSLNLGISNFTIEAWIYPTATNTQSSIIGNFAWSIGYKGGWILYLTSANKLSLRFDSTYINGISAVAINTWSHIAITRVGSTFYVFINGVLDSTTTNSLTIANTAVNVQQLICVMKTDYAVTASTNFIGSMSNIRVVIGTALYSSQFTPSQSPLTAVTGTVLLTAQSSTFIDKSVNAQVLTVSGKTFITPVGPLVTCNAYTPAYHGGSVYLNKADSLNTPGASASMKTFNGDFTFETWIYPSDTSVTQSMLFDTRQDGGVATAFCWGLANGVAATGYVLQLYNNGTNRYGTLRVPYKQWSHVATVRRGTTVTHYVNGVPDPTTFQLSGVFQGTATTNPIMIGNTKDQGIASYGYIGYMSSFRIVNGTAVYSAAFNPSDVPLTAIANTSLLLNFTNAGIYDAAGKNDIETVGTVKVNSAVVKYNISNIYFDGTYALNFPPGAAWNFGTSDFTIEFWYYKTVNPVNQARLFQLSNINNFCGIIIYDSAGMITAGMTSTGTSWDIPMNTPVAAAINTWHHIALVRSGSVFKLYLNGVQIATASSAAAIYYNATHIPALCGITGMMIMCNIEDFRITKTARYIANFTPPTEAFPNH